MYLNVPDFARIYQNVSDVPECTRMYLSIMCASRSGTIYILEHKSVLTTDSPARLNG